MSLHVPGGWAQVAMWVVSPGLTLTVCSNRGLRYSTGIHWKLGLLLLLGLVPRSRELSCVHRAQPLWVGEQAQEPGSCLAPFLGLWEWALLWGFLPILYVVIKSELLHFILPQFAHL